MTKEGQLGLLSIPRSRASYVKKNVNYTIRGESRAENCGATGKSTSSSGYRRKRRNLRLFLRLRAYLELRKRERRKSGPLKV